MSLWEIRTRAQTHDLCDLTELCRCTVLAVTGRFIGRTVSLVEGSEEEMIRLRSIEGIQYVDKAADTDYLDDRSNSKVSVRDRGTRIKRVPA